MGKNIGKLKKKIINAQNLSEEKLKKLNNEKDILENEMEDIKKNTIILMNENVEMKKKHKKTREKLNEEEEKRKTVEEELNKLIDEQDKLDKEYKSSLYDSAKKNYSHFKKIQTKFDELPDAMKANELYNQYYDEFNTKGFTQKYYQKLAARYNVSKNLNTAGKLMHWLKL